LKFISKLRNLFLPIAKPSTNRQKLNPAHVTMGTKDQRDFSKNSIHLGNVRNPLFYDFS